MLGSRKVLLELSLDAGGGQEEMDWTNESVAGRMTEKQ